MIYSLAILNNELETAFFTFPKWQYHYKALNSPVTACLI